jgi:hypothetical protein
VYTPYHIQSLRSEKTGFLNYWIWVSKITDWVSVITIVSVSLTFTLLSINWANDAIRDYECRLSAMSSNLSKPLCFKLFSAPLTRNHASSMSLGSSKIVSTFWVLLLNSLRTSLTLIAWLRRSSSSSSSSLRWARIRAASSSNLEFPSATSWSYMLSLVPFTVAADAYAVLMFAPGKYHWDLRSEIDTFKS